MLYNFVSFVSVIFVHVFFLETPKLGGLKSWPFLFIFPLDQLSLVHYGLAEFVDLLEICSQKMKVYIPSLFAQTCPFCHPKFSTSLT